MKVTCVRKMTVQVANDELLNHMTVDQISDIYAIPWSAKIWSSQIMLILIAIS